jgi:oligoribonuclease NrnB/cAMP/cGMP phosphodiesterase (DHH superfamily)
MTEHAIIYHSADLDGHCSGAIVRSFLLRNGTSEKEIQIIGMDYGRSFDIETCRNKNVYIVDFSFPPDKMLLLKGISKSLIWIDHHITAIEDMKNIEAELLGLRKVGEAACELCWQHFFPEKSMPLAVKLLGRYDVWMWEKEYPAAIDLQKGLQSFNNGYSHPDAEFWNGLLFNGNNSITFNQLLSDGRIINNYAKNVDKKYAFSHAFITKLGDVPMVAINKGMTSSAIFDELDEKYDLPILRCYFSWILDVGYKIGLYTKEADFDVSIIAKSYGGGGHKKAAGFISYNLPFELTTERPTLKEKI